MSKEKKEEIITEEESKPNKLVNTIIVFIIIIFSLFMYSKYIETSFIRVKEYLISKKEIPSNFNGVNVIYISDLLYNDIVNIDYVKDLVNRINEMKPDIILYGGSLINSKYKLKDKESDTLISELNKLDSTIGKYYVMSDTDNDKSNDILNKSGFTLMDNTNELIYNKDNTPICLIGISSYNKGKSNLTNLNLCNGYFTILFTHEADVIDKILVLDNKPNMIMAGNTLGGEINVPFYGNLMKYKGSKKYYLEKYNKNNIDIFISNGIGTKELNLRLNNIPSFSLFRLNSTN